MAKIEQLLRVEINPQNPVAEIMQLIGVVVQNSPGAEEAILNGLHEGIDILKQRTKGSE